MILVLLVESVSLEELADAVKEVDWVGLGRV